MVKAQGAQKSSKPAGAKPAEPMRRWSHGHFYWNELMTRDVSRAKKFYETTLGWRFEAMPMSEGTYWIAKQGNGETIGGIFEMKGPQMANVPEHWMAYIAVDDVDRRVAKAVAEGATICKPAFDVPGVGRIALISEPGGARIGWMTPVR